MCALTGLCAEENCIWRSIMRHITNMKQTWVYAQGKANTQQPLHGSIHMVHSAHALECLSENEESF